MQRRRKQNKNNKNNRERSNFNKICCCRLEEELKNSARKYDTNSTLGNETKLINSILQFTEHMEKEMRVDPKAAKQTESGFLRTMKSIGSGLMEIAPTILPMVMELL